MEQHFKTLTELKGVIDGLSKDQTRLAGIIAEQIKSMPPEQQQILKRMQKQGLRMVDNLDTKGITDLLADTLKKINDNGNG